MSTTQPPVPVGHDREVTTEDAMFRDLAPLPGLDLEGESDADRAAAAAWDEWQADLAEDARSKGREAEASS